MSLSSVTPIVLTFNEGENIGRTLESLRGFPRVVVVDSGSSDSTAAEARSFRNVTWFTHEFEGHVSQWTWALERTGIDTPFVLALDADMAITDELAREISATAAVDGVDGAILRFEYRIRGVPLAGSLYPPQLRMLRRARAIVGDAGHTQAFRVDGRVRRLSSPLIHDDWKPLESFVKAQLKYSAIEVQRLREGPGALNLKSQLRRSFPFAPLLVWLVAWLRAGGPFGGPAARRYALERLIYESMLRWRVEDSLLAKKPEN